MNNEYISHHGIKGQKWGIRRFQNEDGTLTPEGIARYRQESQSRYSKIRPNAKKAATSFASSIGVDVVGGGIVGGILARATNTGSSTLATAGAAVGLTTNLVSKVLMAHGAFNLGKAGVNAYKAYSYDKVANAGRTYRDVKRDLRIKDE